MAHTFENGELLTAEKVNTHLNHSGQIACGVTPANSTGSTTVITQVTFDEPFDTAPALSLSVEATTANSYSVTHTSVTTEGFQIRLYRSPAGSGTVNVRWIATTLGMQ